MKKVPSSPGTIPKHPRSAVVPNKKSDEIEAKTAKEEKAKVPVSASKLQRNIATLIYTLHMYIGGNNNCDGIHCAVMSLHSVIFSM